MTKKILLLIFILSFFNIVSQNSKFEIGTEIGVNISDFRYIEAKYVEGFAINRISFGIVGKFNFSKNWALKSKLKYEGKGMLNKANIGTIPIAQKLNYLVLPLMAEWRIGNGNLQGFLNLGIYGGVLISATRSYDHRDERDIKDKFYPYDSGIAGGIGAIYKLKNNFKITLDLGGQYGMFTVNLNAGNSIGWRSNQTLSTNIGLLFGL